PLINRFCGVPQSSGPAGDAEITTGALNPTSILHDVVRVNPPAASTLKMLLSPLENVVTSVNVPTPPQHANGNAVDGNPASPSAGNVACTRVALPGVTFVNSIGKSGTPSPSVSHVKPISFVPVFPGLCSCTPVSLANPWH